MMAPAILDIERDLHSFNSVFATFSISIFVLGFGIGPLVIAPLSELYGRNLIYQLSNVFFTIFSVLCAVAQSMGALVVFRLLTGLAGSAPLSNGGGTIADLVPKHRRGLVTTLMLVGQLMGPVIGPTIGGFLSQAVGWRWIFWALAIAVGRSVFLVPPSTLQVISPSKSSFNRPPN
jgi:multidrug resistance protein